MKKSKQTASKKTETATPAQQKSEPQNTTKDFLEWAFYNTMPAAVLCIAKHLMETGNADFEAYLQKWRGEQKAVTDCLNDLDSCGFDAAQAELISVLAYKPGENPKIGIPTVDELNESHEDAIFEFFKNLSDRDKLIISAFDWICTAGNDGVIDRRLREIIGSYDAKQVPADCRWLQGVKVFAELVASS
jgi:hypothetical protein